jgi:macrolide transport system ATP-binding/permease protein
MTRSAWWRLSGLFGRQKRERELADELESHLQMHAEDIVNAGMNADQARRRARLELGGVEKTKQAWRERDTVPWIENLLQDVRFAARQLRLNPGFALTAVLMLTLGIGASVAIFAFVDAALIKPLPYKEPTRLVSPTETAAIMGRANLSYPDYLDWKRMNKVFISFDVVGGTGFLVNTPSGMEPVPAVRMSDGLFRTLGVKPMLGRDFYEGEDLPAAPKTVILSYDSWMKRFNGSRDAIGKSIDLSGTPHTVVGVLPSTFQFALRGAAEFYVPLHAAGECDLRRSCHSLIGIARLRDGITIAMAQANARGEVGGTHQHPAGQLQLQHGLDPFRGQALQR